VEGTTAGQQSINYRRLAKHGLRSHCFSSSVPNSVSVSVCGPVDNYSRALCFELETVLPLRPHVHALFHGVSRCYFDK